MAGDAPADRRVLAIRSIDTKFVMDWMRGDCCLTVDRWVQATEPQFLLSSSTVLQGSSMAALWFR